MKYAVSVLCALLVPASTLAADLPTDIDDAYKAAGMTQKDGHWTGCPDDDYGMAEVADGDYRDINGDGVKDLVITDSGTFCYGATGQGFVLLDRASGKWQVVYQSEGIPLFKDTAGKATGTWPDITIGGPGFCFPVMRWNGQTYMQDHQEADGGGSC